MTDLRLICPSDLYCPLWHFILVQSPVAICPSSNISARHAPSFFIRWDCGIRVVRDTETAPISDIFQSVRTCSDAQTETYSTLQQQNSESTSLTPMYQVQRLTMVSVLSPFTPDDFSLSSPIHATSEAKASSTAPWQLAVWHATGWWYTCQSPSAFSKYNV